MNFRGPLPLDDDEFAAIRAKVMAKIGERRRSAFEWSFAVAALLITILSAIVARQPAVPPAPGVRASRPHPTGVPPVGIARHESQPQPHPRRRETRRRSGRDARPPQVARIELHTSDPDIRIIWITN